MIRIHTSMDAFKDDSVCLFNFFNTICLLKPKGECYTYQNSGNNFIISHASSNIILDMCINDYDYINENFDLLVDKQSISMTYLVEKMIFLSFKIVGNQTYCEQVLTAKDTEKELIKIANELYKKYYITAVKHIHLTKRVLKNAQ